METKSQPKETIKCYECGLTRDITPDSGTAVKSSARGWVQKHCLKGRTRGCSTTLLIDGKSYKKAHPRSGKQRAYLFGGRVIPNKNSPRDLRTLCDDLP